MLDCRENIRQSFTLLGKRKFYFLGDCIVVSQRRYSEGLEVPLV